ncbi:MAG TPA: hypothetical protein VIM57_07540 [Luteolibacter sp.]
MKLEGEVAEVSRSAGKKKRPRYSRATRLMVTVFCGWVLMIAAIVALSTYLWDRDKEIGAQTRSKDVLMARRGTDEDSAMLQSGIQPCGQTLAGFLSARTPEERSQFVRKPLETIGRMTRYYALNPAVTVASEDLSVDQFSILHVGGERGISILWKTADGRIFDSVFFPEKGEWRLDWDHFVRYSDHPWTLFLSGGGAETGEFRLLARERLAHDRRQTGEIGVVFYAPRSGSPEDTGPPSPEFLLSRESEEGRLLAAAFAGLEANRRPFGDKTRTYDPEEMVRLRVRVRREPTPEGDRFVLEKVLAGHWLGVDDAGIEPPPAQTPAPSTP